MNHFSKILSICLILALGFVLTVSAQNEERKFDASGQLRLRGETDGKDFNNDTEEIDFTLMRTRLNLKFSYTDKLVVFAQLQDSRTFGEENVDGQAATLTSIRNVDLHQGYFQINRLFFPWLNYKFGRMELSYGAQRLIGVNQWSNIGRTFNASVMTLKFNAVQIDFIGSTLSESFQAPDTLKGDQVLNGVWLKYNRPKSFNLNLYVLTDENKQQNADKDSKFLRSTVGTRVESKFSQLNLEAEANLQAGKTSFTQDVLAFYLSGALSFDFDPDGKTQVGLGVDYLTGDKPGTDKYECFNTLYAARHKFFGYMDYFTDIPKHTRNLGLTDLIARAKFSPFEKMSLAGDLHYFRLSESAKLKDGTSSQELGTELDLTFGYDYMKNVNFTLGTSVFVPAQVFEEWKGKDPSFWIYAQTTVNF